VERLEKAHGEGTVGVAAAVARLEGALGQAVRAEREGEVLHALHLGCAGRREVKALSREAAQVRTRARRSRWPCWSAQSVKDLAEYLVCQAWRIAALRLGQPGMRGVTEGKSIRGVTEGKSIMIGKNTLNCEMPIGDFESSQRIFLQ
jgi:hypothetical protein